MGLRRRDFGVGVLDYGPWSFAASSAEVGGRIKGTLGDIDPLNKVPLKRARSRVQKGYPLRDLANTTPYEVPARQSHASALWSKAFVFV